MQYICHFISFCMFGNYWGCICRSRKSAEKLHVKIPDVGSSENYRKIQKSIFWEISDGAKRGKGGEPPEAGRPLATGPPRAAAGTRPWPLWPPSGSPSAYYSPLT